MYAIVRAGGRQEKVAVGDLISLDRVQAKPGETVVLPTVLIVDGDKVNTDAKGVTVTAEVIDHNRGPKIEILRYKNKTGYRRRQGHRSDLTDVQIISIGSEKIAAGDKATAKAKPVVAKKAAPVKAAPAAKKAAAPAAEAAENPAAKKAAAPAAKKAPIIPTTRPRTILVWLTAFQPSCRDFKTPSSFAFFAAAPFGISLSPQIVIAANPKLAAFT